MIKNINSIISLLDSNEKNKFKKLIFFMLVAMVFETLGIAAIFPIINYLTENQSSFIFLDIDFSLKPALKTPNELPRFFRKLSPISSLESKSLR